MNIRKNTIPLLLLLTHTFGFGQIDSLLQVSLNCGDQQFYAQTPSPNGKCFALVSLKSSGFENGSCITNAKLYWNIYVDLYNNGTYDYELSSFIATHDDNLENDSNNNGIKDGYVAPTLSGEQPSLPIIHLDYEKGTNSVKWEVSNSCGNKAVCFSNFFIIDGLPPNIQVVKSDTFLMGKNSDEIKAIDFDKGSTDNCSDPYGLIFTFEEAHPILSQLSYEHYFKGKGEEASHEEYQRGRAQRWLPAQRTSIKMIPCFDAFYSPKMMSITAWDSDFNYTTDIVTLFIDPSACEPYRIFGDLVNLNSKPVEKVNVTIAANRPEYPKTGLWNGQYHFFESYGSFEIKPTKTDDYRKGVNVADVIALYRHIEGIKKLKTPEQLLAADINQDGQLTENDLIEMSSLISGQTDTFINNDSWIFLPSPYSFKDENQPYDIERTAIVDFSVQTQQNFTGIKVGDVDQSTLNSVVNEIDNTIVLTTDDRWIQNGEEVAASFWLQEETDLQGWEINWQVNGLINPEVESSIEAKFEGAELKNGSSCFSYAILNETTILKKEGEVFKVRGRAERDGLLSSFLGLDKEEGSTIYTEKDVTANKLNLIYLTPREQRQFEVFVGVPNPFADATEIKYYLPAPGEVQYTLSNAVGQVLWSKKLNGNGGRNYLQIKAEDLHNDGLYYVSLRYKDQVQTLPLIIGR